MASYPPPYTPPPGWDPRAQRAAAREQARAYRQQVRQMRFAARSARRSSILAPLLLIGVGVVFLLIEWGKLSRQSVFQWYGHWWPMLFLAAGLVVLAEWGWDQYHLRDGSVPQYRRSIGGGAFILLLILGLVGFASRDFWQRMSGGGLYRAFHMNADDMDQFLGDKHESDQVMALAFAHGGSLEISNPRGDIVVSGTSDDGQVHVAVHKQVYTRSDAEAERRASDLSPTTANAGTVTTISIPSVQGGRADLTLTVPADAGLTVTADNGEIRVSAMKAPVSVTANRGDVDLSALTGPATAHMNSGNSSLAAHSLSGGIDIAGHAQDLTISDVSGPATIMGEFFGTTHLEHINGAIHFRTSRTELQLTRLDGEIEVSPHMNLTVDQAMGPFILTTSNRNLTLDRIAGPISITDRNGSIDLTAAPSIGVITVANRNGSVRTTLPDNAAFSVQAATTDGDISTDFPLTTQGNGNHRQLDGNVGTGGPLIHIVTTNGDISLSKGDVAPLPTAPPPLPKLSAQPVSPSAPAPPKTPRHPATPPVPPQPASGSTSF